MARYPRVDTFLGEVHDESGWCEKALFHALNALRDGDPPAFALRAIELQLSRREREATDGS